MDMNQKIITDTFTAEDFNTTLLPTLRPHTHICKHTQTKTKERERNKIIQLNDVIDQMDLRNIFRTFQPNTTEYKFLSESHGTFKEIDHNMVHKASLNKSTKIEMISCVLQDCNEIE